MKEELEEIGVPTDYVTSQYPNYHQVEDLNLNVDLGVPDLIPDHASILNNFMKLIIIIRSLKTDLNEMNTVGVLKNMLDEENEKLKQELATKEEELTKKIEDLTHNVEENSELNTGLNTQIETLQGKLKTAEETVDS